MRSFKLYLPKRRYQEVDSMRLLHIFKSIDISENEVRVYIEGQDFFESDAPHPLPYATLDGKKKSYENLYNEAIGEKIHHDGKSNQDI